MGLFDNISRKFGENLATEVLVYFLKSQDHHIPFQKLFFQRLLGIAAGSGDLGIEISEQNEYSAGKPDFTAVFKNSVFIFEVKLGSYLSGDDQLLLYTKIFDRISELSAVFQSMLPDNISARHLILIAPKSTIPVALNQTNKALRQYEKTFESYCTERNIIFTRISWEDILSDLDRTNPLQNELFLYVEPYLDQKFTKEEIMVLKNKDIGSALSKLPDNVQAVKNSLDLEPYHYSLGKLSVFFRWSGFGIEHELFSLWFGYSLQDWSRLGTPIILSLEKIKDRKDDVNSALVRAGFVTHAEYGYVHTFDPEESALWSGQLQQILRHLSLELGHAPNPA